MDKLFICLEKEVFPGNVLDITYDNKNIIYNANKYYDKSIDPSYIEPDNGKSDSCTYDSCVLFFSLNMLRSMKEKEMLISEIHNKLCSNGYMYIWDVVGNRTAYDVTVSMPDKTLEKFRINCYNLIPSNRLDIIKLVIKKYFDIEAEIVSDMAYKLVCKRKDVI